MQIQRNTLWHRLGWKTPDVGNVWRGGVLSFNRSIVTIYKLAGFVLLTVILVGMFAYLAMSGFFLFSAGWAVPSILTPNNDKVVQAEMAWLSQRRELEQLEGQRVGLQLDLAVAQNAGAIWKEFGGAYRVALGGETKRSKAKLAAVEGIVQVLETSAGDGATGTLNMETLDRQLANGLIDIEEHAKAKAALRQRTLEAAERREQALALSERAQNLRGMIDTGSGTDVEALMRRRPLLESNLETANQGAREAALSARLATLDSLIASYRETTDRMQQNPYVRAADGEVQVAFVPYTNLENAAAGTPVWDCLLSFVLCRQVGSVTGVVGGEVLGSHPITGRDLRGRMVELRLDDLKVAESRSLILKRPPLFL